MNRQELLLKIKENQNKIDDLKKEIIELKRQQIMLSDETQRYEEKIESHPKSKYQRKPHYLDGKLVGRIFYKEEFIDEDTKEVIVINRSDVVKVDGNWI